MIPKRRKNQMPDNTEATQKPSKPKKVLPLKPDKNIVLEAPVISNDDEQVFAGFTQQELYSAVLKRTKSQSAANHAAYMMAMGSSNDDAFDAMMALYGVE